MGKKQTSINSKAIEKKKSEMTGGFVQKVLLGLLLTGIISFFLFYNNDQHVDPSTPKAQENQTGNVQESPTSNTKNPLKHKKYSYHPDVGKYTNPVINNQTNPEFSNLTETNQVVQMLQEFVHVDLHPQIHFDTGIHYGEGHMGLKNDYQYCLKSDSLKLQHPEIILDNYYILTDFQNDELPRDIVKDFGIDVMPAIYQGMSQQQNNRRIYNISQEAALIHSRISRFHHFHPFGHCLFCIFQTSNHIPGKWSITGKDLVIDNLKTYENRIDFVDAQQCKQSITFMPITYRFYNKTECKSFFQYIKTDEYTQSLKEKGLAFILKKGRDIHRGEGITILTPSNQAGLEQMYDSGKKCGTNKETLQAVTYIYNPLLYKGNKIEIRIYFFIASTNPLIVYSENLAHLRMCGIKYDKHSKQKEVHVCNVAISTKSQSREKIVVDFPLEGLRDYLIEQKQIEQDPKDSWLQENIYPQIYRAIVHITRLGEHDFLKDSRVNENFAIDFLMDDNYKIWFLENNPNPQILRMSEARERRHYKMFGDLFEIQFKYLRSRFKRVQQYAVRLKQALQEARQKNTKIDSKKWKKEFLQINSNYLEPEYQITQNNTYVKIYDETLKGKDKFMGYLPEGCLYKK